MVNLPIDQDNRIFLRHWKSHRQNPGIKPQDDKERKE